MVRFLTRRFIWEYDPTLGKTLPAFTAAAAAAALPLSTANAKKMTLLLLSHREANWWPIFTFPAHTEVKLDRRVMDGSHYLYLEVQRSLKEVCWEVNMLLYSTENLLLHVQ